MHFDSIAQQALDIMESGQSHLFLTGKAGTGKSTLLRHFLQTTSKDVVVLAPTGVAALNVGGQTIHSFCRFSTTVTVEEAQKKGGGRKGDEMIEAIDTIVIDEVSMVRADMLDCVDIFLQKARDDSQPFGGIQMVFVGDLYQLPPVVGRQERHYFEAVYQTAYFFSARIFGRSDFSMELIELEKVYRQNDDDFLRLLNKIRNKSTTARDIALLNRHVGEKPARIPLGTMYLTAKNADADSVNAQELAQLEEEEVCFDARVRGDFPRGSFPTSEHLFLKVGSQVMFVANNPIGLWANGTLGYITAIDAEEQEVMVEIFGGDEVIVGMHTWQVSNYVYDTKTQSLTTEDLGSFVQLPLKLAWATTIHKSQGKTYDDVLINPSGIFERGQLYVALSRCRSLDGITLTAPIKPGHVRVDYRIIQFLTRYQYASARETMDHDTLVDLLDRYAGTETQLEIVYLKASDVKSTRVISVFEVGEMWYGDIRFHGVRCYCHLRKAERVFNTQKILEVKVVGDM